MSITPPLPSTEPPWQEAPPPSPWKRAGGALAAIGLLLAKFAAKLKALLILLPKIKLLTTSGTMLNRKAQSLGTKASGAVWTLQASVTLS